MFFAKCWRQRKLIFQKYWTANKKKGKRNALSLKEEIFKNNKVMVTWSSPSRHYNCQENRLNDVFLLEDLHSGFFCIQLIHFVLPITLSHLSVLEIFAVGHMFRMVAKKWFFFLCLQKKSCRTSWMVNCQ